jgi:hypothetical protein
LSTGSAARSAAARCRTSRPTGFRHRSGPTSCTGASFRSWTSRWSKRFGGSLGGALRQVGIQAKQLAHAVAAQPATKR